MSKVRILKTRYVPPVGLLEKDTDYDESFLGETLTDQLIQQGLAYRTVVKQKTKKEQDLEKIITAMAELIDNEEVEDLTDDGKPNANILSNMVGFTVSAKLRDQAWEIFKGERS